MVITLDKKIKEEEKRRILIPFLRQFGRGAFAYATLQRGMKQFFDENLGYISYVTVRHPVFALFSKKFVLADPICAQKDSPELIKRFLRKHPRAVFVPTSEETGLVLRDLGFKVNCIGYEPEISIQEYNTKGNWNELDLIKRARNESKRNGIEVREGIKEVDKRDLEAISQKWIQGKKLNDREIWVYARRPVFEEEEDVRKFIAYQNEMPVGFVFYDPMYKDGKVIGYSDNISRCDEAKFGKLSVAINMEAIDKFKEEGKEILNLCIAPFHKVGQGKMNDDGLTKMFFEFMYNYGDNVYNFKGLSFHKSKYRAREKPVYFASNGIMPVNDVYLAFKSSDIVTSYPETLLKTIKYFFQKKLKN